MCDAGDEVTKKVLGKDSMSTLEHVERVAIYSDGHSVFVFDGTREILLNEDLLQFLNDRYMGKIIVHDFKHVRQKVKLIDCHADTAIAYKMCFGHLSCDLLEIQNEHFPNETFQMKGSLIFRTFDMLPNNVIDMYSVFEKPITLITEKMESKGVLVDLYPLEEELLSVELKMTKLENSLFDVKGEFNWRSEKERSQRNLNMGLMRIVDDLRSCSAYGQKLAELIRYTNPEDHRLHSKLNQLGTSTGRYTSNDPALQNLSSQMRKFIVVPKGKVLLAVDYSQMELCVLGHLSKDEKLRHAILNGRDLHKELASAIFDTPFSAISEEQRKIGKMLNFSILYGKGASSLAKDLSCSKNEAQDLIESYFECYPGVKSLQQQLNRIAEQKCFVKSLTGRLRAVDNKKYAVLNYAIQGSAADLMKLAMLKIDRAIINADLVLQIHDELLFEVDRSELNDTARAIKQKMESVYSKASVPFRVTLSYGNSWGDMRPLKLVCS